MHPVLLQVGSLKIYSYGVFVAIAFLAALWVSAREIARQGQDREKFLDMGFWVVLSAIVGARTFHVLVYWREYAEAPAEMQPSRPKASPSAIPSDDASATGRNGIRCFRRYRMQAAVAAMNPP